MKFFPRGSSSSSTSTSTSTSSSPSSSSTSSTSSSLSSSLSWKKSSSATAKLSSSSSSGGGDTAEKNGWQYQDNEKKKTMINDQPTIAPTLTHNPYANLGGVGNNSSYKSSYNSSNNQNNYDYSNDRMSAQSTNQISPPTMAPPPPAYNETDAGRGAGNSYPTEPSVYSERQMTAEEIEQQDIGATKQQIRAIKQEDVSSTRNALRLAEQAFQTGSETLNRLGAQGERLHNAEKNLDLASNQNRIASEKASELKKLNRSMFAVHVGNPFTSSEKREKRNNQIIETHQRERDERADTRAQAYRAQMRQEQRSKDLRDGAGYDSASKMQTGASLAERAKYQFEADSEDEQMENEIDSNLNQLQHAAGRLNVLASAMGSEVDAQNKVLDRINPKIERVDDEIEMNRTRLNRIQ